MSTQGRNILLDNFAGGINEAFAEDKINKNQSPKMQNVEFNDGNLKRIKGITPYVTAALPGKIGSMMVYYKNNTGYLLLASGGSLYKLEGNVFTQIASGFTSDNFDAVNFSADKEVIIFGNGTDNTKYYDGVNVLDLKNRMPVYDEAGALTGWMDANYVEHPTEAECTTLAPKSGRIELHYNRIWMADDKTVYFSTNNEHGFDYQDWLHPEDLEEEVNQHGGEIDIYTNDGGRIIGLKVAFDDVLIFKTKNIFKIFGTYPGEYRRVQIFSANGAIADKSIATSNVGAFFIDSKAIYQYGGVNCTPISQKIDNTFKTLNENYLDKACAIFHDNKYILAVPEGTSTENNLIIIYDVLSQTFSFKRGFVVTQFQEIGEDVIFSSNNGKIYKLDLGDNFDGQAINAVYETGKFNLGLLNADKTIEAFYFTSKGSGSLKVTAISDRGTEKSKIVTLTANEKIFNINLNLRGRWLKFRFENLNGSDFTISNVSIDLELDFD
jgi:hypothetical protein